MTPRGIKPVGQPRPTLDLERDYTIDVHHDLRRYRLRPYWAVITQGIGTYDELIFRARSYESLIAKCENFIKKDMKRRGRVGEPKITVECDFDE